MKITSPRNILPKIKVPLLTDRVWAETHSCHIHQFTTRLIMCVNNFVSETHRSLLLVFRTYEKNWITFPSFYPSVSQNTTKDTEVQLGTRNHIQKTTTSCIYCFCAEGFFHDKTFYPISLGITSEVTLPWDGSVRSRTQNVGPLFMISYFI